MVAQAKIFRVLKLISLLKSKSRSIKDLALSLDTTTRSIYRYLELLEQVGFLIDKDFNNRYFIHTSEDEADDQLSFSSEEAGMLKELIRTGARNHPLKETLLKKLYLNSELSILSKNLFNARLGILVNKIGESLRYKNQVIFKDYHSAHSDVVRDRLVEPVYFSENYEDIIAFDTEDMLNKHFKLDRIGDVIILDKPQKNQDKHQKLKTDMFGMSGDHETWITLKMGLRAYVLMREEYPGSIPFLTKQESNYIFHGPVLSFLGIGRFVMGLMDIIKVENPKEFNKYLNQVVDKKSF